jgi:hypothetical protein
MRIALNEFMARMEKAPQSVASQVPVPDWSHLGAISCRNLVIDMSDIEIDETDGNPVRFVPHTGEQIEELRLSFSVGVEDSEYPPAVVRTELRDKPYRLHYGNGRTESLSLLGQKKWVFTQIEASDENLRRIGLAENAKRLPKVDIKLQEMINGLNNAIIEDETKRDEKWITKEAKLLWNPSKQILGRIVKGVMERQGIEQPYWFWSSAVKVKNWIDNHAEDKSIAIDGNFDEGRDMYGSMCKNGYLPAKTIQAFQRMAKTGKKTYVIGHVDTPSEKSSIHDKRRAFMEAYTNIKSTFEDGIGVPFPIEVLGFLPQICAKEKLEGLIPCPT